MCKISLWNIRRFLPLKIQVLHCSDGGATLQPSCSSYFHQQGVHTPPTHSCWFLLGFFFLKKKSTQRQREAKFKWNHKVLVKDWSIVWQNEWAALMDIVLLDLCAYIYIHCRWKKYIKTIFIHLCFAILILISPLSGLKNITASQAHWRRFRIHWVFCHKGM